MDWFFQICQPVLTVINEKENLLGGKMAQDNINFHNSKQNEKTE